MDQEGQPRLTLVNARMMFFIIITLKLNLRVDQDKMQVTGQKGQYGLTRVNIWIKVIIIIILKPDSGVGLRRFKSQGGRVNLVDLFFFLNNQSNLIQTIFLYNNNGFLTCVSSQVDLGFLSGLVKLNLPLFFFKLELVQAPGQSGSGSTRQVSHSFITRVIIILLILTLNIN